MSADPDSASHERKLSVMFVCLGNICRSPMASAVFQHIVHERGLSQHFDRIESAGTSDYHIGEEPDERTVATCRQHAIPIDSVAQQVRPAHFKSFTHIFAMDKQNLANLQRIQPADGTAEVKLFGSYGDGKVIGDPYYGVGGSGFESCYEQIQQYSDGFLASLKLGGSGKKIGKARS